MKSADDAKDQRDLGDGRDRSVPKAPGTNDDADTRCRAGGDPAESSTTPLAHQKSRITGFDPDPVVEAYKRDIDRTLLRQNLRRSVAERMANLVALQRLAMEARRAGRKRNDAP